MSDIIDETEVGFEHYVTATKKIVEEFRDKLAEHTAELVHCEVKIIGGGRGGVSVADTKASTDPQRHAELHRIRIACDNFLLNALAGND